jgi:hypothetical protein
VYVVHFLVELEHLIAAAFGSQTALQALITSIGYKTDGPDHDAERNRHHAGGAGAD